jgi:hypothetical protein
MTEKLIEELKKSVLLLNKWQKIKVALASFGVGVITTITTFLIWWYFWR